MWEVFFPLLLLQTSHCQCCVTTPNKCFCHFSLVCNTLGNDKLWKLTFLHCFCHITYLPYHSLFIQVFSLLLINTMLTTSSGHSVRSQQFSSALHHQSASQCLYMSSYCSCFLDILSFAYPESYPQSLSTVGLHVSYLPSETIQFGNQNVFIVSVTCHIMTPFLSSMTLLVFRRAAKMTTYKLIYN